MHAAKIDKWGNSAALRLTTAVLREAGLRVGEAVEIEHTPHGLLLRPAKPPLRYTLDSLLAQCDVREPMPTDQGVWLASGPAGDELL